MAKQIAPKAAVREIAAARELEAEFRRWRRGQGMEPTKGEIFDLLVWELLLRWQGGGVLVTRAGTDYHLDPFEEEA